MSNDNYDAETTQEVKSIKVLEGTLVITINSTVDNPILEFLPQYLTPNTYYYLVGGVTYNGRYVISVEYV